MKQIIVTICILLAAMLFITACSGGQPEKITKLEDLDNKKIGVAMGTVFDQIALDIGGEPAYYSEMSAGLEDVRNGRISGYIADLSNAGIFAGTPAGEDFMIIEVPAEIFSAPMGAISMNQGIIDRFNRFLSEINSGGILDDMKSRWLEAEPDLDAPMPDIPLTGENGTLKVATTGLSMPFSYIGADNEPKGFCVELAIRFAAHEGMEIEFAMLDFSGFIPYIISERADIGIDALSITEERRQSVLFSEPIYEDRAGILVLK